MNVDPAALVQQLGGIGVAAVVVWLIVRQSKSDAQKQLDSALLRLVRLERKVERMQLRERAHASLLASHSQWDARAMAALPPEHAAALGAPPPLYLEDPQED